MAKYKILVIQHLLKNNIIAKSGDIVDGTKFVNLQDSLDGKYCEAYDAESGDDIDELKTVRSRLLAEVKSMKGDDLKDFGDRMDYDYDTKGTVKAIRKEIRTFIKEDENLIEKSLKLEVPDGEETVDLSLLDETELQTFATDNSLTLSAEVIAEGKDAMISSIVKQLEEAE